MSKKSQKVLASSTVLSLVLTTALSAVPASAAVTTGTALGGDNRVETSVQIADKAFANWTSSKSAVIAYGNNDNLVDALAIAPLAYAKQAPIMLTNSKTALEKSVLDELVAKKVETVYIAGLSIDKTAIEAQLKAAGLTVTVKQLGGKGRIETANAINAELGSTSKVALVNGYAVIDALSVASIAAHDGMSIVLTNKDGSLPAGTDLSGKTVYAIGGTGVIPQATVDAAKATRLGGNDRYATNAAVLTGLDASLKYDTVYAANGMDKGVDALPGSVLAAYTQSPIVLTSTKSEDAVTKVIAGKAGKINTIVPLGKNVAAQALTDLNTAATAKELKVDSVSAVNAKTLKVTFNAPVDTTKAVLTVKSGNVTINMKAAVWNDAKTEATLEAYSNLAAGDYTVTLSGLDNISKDANTGKVTVKASTITSIQIVNDQLVKTADPKVLTVPYKVLDQYGTDITKTTSIDNPATPGSCEGLVISCNIGTATLDPSTGLVTVTCTTEPKKGDSAVITIVDPSGVNVTKTLTVNDISVVSSVSFSELKNKDSKVLRVGTNLANDIFAFDVTAKDQYGNAITTDTQLANDVKLIYTFDCIKPTFKKATATAPAKLELDPVAGKSLVEGTYVITVVAGSNITTLTFKVEKNVAVSTFTMAAPTDLAIAGEDVNIPFTAVDQYGNPVTQYDALNGAVTFTVPSGVTCAFDKNVIDGTATLKLTIPDTFTAKTLFIISSVTVPGVANTSTVSVPVNAKAVPTRIVGLTDASTAFEDGAKATFSKDNFAIKDQYDRDIAIPAGWSIKLAADDAAFDTVTKTGTDVTPTGTVDFTGTSDAGVEAVTAKLNDGTKTYDNSAFSFNLSSVAKKDITSYAVDTADKMFAVAANPYAGSTAEEEAYAADVDIYGKTASGDRVALADADITNVNSTSSKLQVVNNTKIFATGLAATDKDVTATLVVAINGANGIQTITKNITLTAAAKVGGDVAVKGTKGSYLDSKDNAFYMSVAQVSALSGMKVTSSAQYDTPADRANVYFEIKDQYGIASSSVAPTFYTVTATDSTGAAKTGVYSINSTTGALRVVGTPVLGDTITITAITSTGTVKTIVINVAQ